MNHAANNIEAKSKTLKDLLKERKYQVKYFQREYKWEKNHIEDLIIDLEKSFFSNFQVEHTREDVPDYDCYYMGPVVLYREKSSFVIVDGQQRLTSFTLLLIYLTHLQKEIFVGNKKKIQNLDEYIYSQPYEKETFNLEIQEREDILRCLFKSLDLEDGFLLNESSQNILDRYIDIVELFPPTLKKDYVLPLFINWLVEKLIFIEILSQSSDSAYTIFETMNDRGLNLTQSEMLKSYLLSSVKDEEKIKELDAAWKQKISLIKTYSSDEDQDFFKAWLRAKYAVGIRTTEKGAINEDFEKISTRFSNWVQDNSKRLLNLNTPDDYFYFIESDFDFFSDIYLKLSEMEFSESLPEQRFKLLSYKGISQSLSYPLIISTIQKIDDNETVNKKIETSVSYLDSFSIYRLLLNESITHSTVRNKIYTKIKEIRDKSFEEIRENLNGEIEDLKKRFLKEIDYIPFYPNFGKYVLARVYKSRNPPLFFENIYFQRRTASLVLFHFFTLDDVDVEVQKLPKGLKDIIIRSLCSYCLVTKEVFSEVSRLSLVKRIQYLLNKGFIYEFSDLKEVDLTNLREFFITRNKRMKETVINLWKV